MKKLLVIMMLLFSFNYVYVNEVYAFSNRVLDQGDSGDDIIELQARLQYLGFYRGKINGKFDYRTFLAVKKFQWKFHLPITGKAEAKTKKWLVSRSDFDKEWVHAQIKKGNIFTYYGGIPLSQQTRPPSQAPAPSSPPSAGSSGASTPAPATSASAYENQVLALTNAERSKQGLRALQADASLMATARAKSIDMQQNNYFSHTSPTLGSPFQQIKAAGISYRSAGENIAKGQQTPEEVVKAWMNSPGHRANILNANYTHLGVGFAATDKCWTQQFIQK